MRAFITFVFAILLGAILLPVSFIYSLFVYRKERTLTSFFYSNAITIDILGNVNGELIELMVTKERKTLFGQRGVTISASLGQLEYRKKLNLFGKFISKTLDKAFNEPNHCHNAFVSYLENN